MARVLPTAVWQGGANVTRREAIETALAAWREAERHCARAADSSDEDTPETEANRRTTPRPARPGETIDALSTSKGADIELRPIAP